MYTLKFSPNFTQKIEILYKLAILYARTNQLEQAINYFNLVLVELAKATEDEEKAERKFKALIQLGICYEEKKNYEEALKSYESALDLYKGNTNALLHLSWCNFLNQNTSKALEYIDKVMAVKKSDKDANYIKGRIMLYLKDYKRAQEYLKHAVIEDPNNPIFLNSLGVAKCEAEEYLDAHTDFNTIVQIEENLPEVWLNIGMMYEKSERYDEAVSTYNKLIQLIPKCSESSRRKDALRTKSPIPIEFIHLEYKVPNFMVILKDYHIPILPPENDTGLPQGPIANTQNEELKSKKDKKTEKEELKATKKNNKKANVEAKKIFVNSVSKPNEAGEVKNKEAEAKVDEVKVIEKEDVKIEEAKAEEAKAEEAKGSEARIEEVKIEEAKVEDVKAGKGKAGKKETKTKNSSQANPPSPQPSTPKPKPTAAEVGSGTHHGIAVQTTPISSAYFNPSISIQQYDFGNSIFPSSSMISPPQLSIPTLMNPYEIRPQAGNPMMAMYPMIGSKYSIVANPSPMPFVPIMQMQRPVDASDVSSLYQLPQGGVIVNMAMPFGVPSAGQVVRPDNPSLILAAPGSSYLFPEEYKEHLGNLQRVGQQPSGSQHSVSPQPIMAPSIFPMIGAFPGMAIGGRLPDNILSIPINSQRPEQQRATNQKNSNGRRRSPRTNSLEFKAGVKKGKYE